MQTKDAAETIADKVFTELCSFESIDDVIQTVWSNESFRPHTFAYEASVRAAGHFTPIGRNKRLLAPSGDRRAYFRRAGRWRETCEEVRQCIARVIRQNAPDPPDAVPKAAGPTVEEIRKAYNDSGSGVVLLKGLLMLAEKHRQILLKPEAYSVGTVTEAREEYAICLALKPHLQAKADEASARFLDVAQALVASQAPEVVDV